MTIRELRTRLDYWQHRLNLSDWVIHLKWGAAKLEGCCHWQTEYGKATVEINRACRTPETILVHELLHITLEGHLVEPSEYDQVYERALNKLAAAFMITQGDTQ